jgi:hypothetical protein
MTVRSLTADYETWLGQFVDLDPSELAFKHRKMADRFPFFRATYYLWAVRWPPACPDLVRAPRVLGVGDIHVENFGTWRDPDGRLCWGVNDFDEADELPYTSDLVRLAASARVARRAGAWRIKTNAAAEAVLDGYRAALEAGGSPFVLEERHPHLRALAMRKERDPVAFWGKLRRLLKKPPADLSAAAREALFRDLPPGADPAVRARKRTGMGNLGRPRFIALAESAGGFVAREVKAVAPPATAWADGRAAPAPARIAEAVGRAVRCPDPFYRADPEWVARRIGPRCDKIGLDVLTEVRAARWVLWAMGGETANVHLGTPGAPAAILADLDRRPAGWLAAAARCAAAAIEKDWRAWRAG